MSLRAPQYGAGAPQFVAERRAAACKRKVRYVTRDEAKARSKVLKLKHRAKLRPYRCEVCGYFHLTKVSTQ